MIILALVPGRMRLAHLYRSLPGVSMSLLDRYLQEMVAFGLVERTRLEEARPPRVELELTEAGRELVPIAAALARWGMRHAWSSPLPRERVDIAALLRLLPFLLERVELPSGSLEAIVTDAEPPLSQLYEVKDGCLRTHDGPAAAGDSRAVAVGEADGTSPGSPSSASIEGDVDAWAAAFGAKHDFAGLTVAGEATLATSILAALSASH
jgi:DNA-binding HxlR family transcriptional regulator